MKVEVFNESMMNETVTRNELKKMLMDSEEVVIGGSDPCKLIVTQVNTKNFRDLPKEFINQLKQEGKMDSYVALITSSKKPYSYESLPIFGSSDKFVTKYLFKNKADAVEDFLNDDRNILKRYNRNNP